MSHLQCFGCLGLRVCAVVRPPLTKIGDAEIARIRQALLEFGPAAPESQRRVGALASGAMRDTHRTGSCGAKPDDVSQLVRPKLRRDFVDASLVERVKVACRPVTGGPSHCHDDG